MKYGNFPPWEVSIYELMSSRPSLFQVSGAHSSPNEASQRSTCYSVCNNTIGLLTLTEGPGKSGAALTTMASNLLPFYNLKLKDRSVNSSTLLPSITGGDITSGQALIVEATGQQRKDRAL